MNRTSFASRDIWKKITPWLAIACVILSTAVLVRRAVTMVRISTTAPGVAVTSGYEEESFFAIWRVAHHQPVYADATRQPYASAYFNWLFYAAYGQAGAVATELGGDSYLPLAGRIASIVAAGVGGAVLFLLLKRILVNQVWAAAALAFFVFSGPIVGWWAFTVRPDILALAFEICGLAVLLLLARSKPLLSAGVAGLLFYAAWSCKQSYVMGLGAAALFLLIRGQWRALILLTLLSISLWVLTFVLMGTGYRVAFQGTATDNVFYFDHGLKNLKDLLLKSGPLFLLLIPWFLHRKQPLSPIASDARLIATLGLLVAFPLAFVASCKLGASSYYYFSALTMLSLVGASLYAVAPKMIYASVFALAAALQLLVLTGRGGNIDLREQTTELSDIWAVWQKQPEPRFSSITSLNLPWLSPDSPPLVLAYNYPLNRASGRKFEHDGLGGLIARGYFKTLLLPAKIDTTYDLNPLTHYTRGATLHGLTLFHRKVEVSP